METLTQKNILHQHLYNTLAHEYKKRACNILIQNDLINKAKNLKNISNGYEALEIGVGGGQMNKALKDVGFIPTGIDIAENMINNAKELNPEGTFIVGNYLETTLEKQYNTIVGLAFIHLFNHEESRRILRKMYYDLCDNGIIHLTTTKESSYNYDTYNKQDYGENYTRYRAKHTPESFLALFKTIPFSIDNFSIENGSDGKQRMSITARKL